MSEHWMENAERVYDGRFLVGEDEWGAILVPRFGWSGMQWRPLSPFSPVDWLRLLSSRLQMKIVWLTSS